MKKEDCQICSQCQKNKLPIGYLNGWKYIHCYECPAASYDDRKHRYWCSKNSEYNEGTDGCILSPIS